MNFQDRLRSKISKYNYFPKDRDLIFLRAAGAGKEP